MRIKRWKIYILYYLFYYIHLRVLLQLMNIKLMCILQMESLARSNPSSVGMHILSSNHYKLPTSNFQLPTSRCRTITIWGHRFHSLRSQNQCPLIVSFPYATCHYFSVVVLICIPIETMGTRKINRVNKRYFSTG